jgi:hypothetical protein
MPAQIAHNLAGEAPLAQVSTENSQQKVSSARK